jgi:hypothetical protein
VDADLIERVGDDALDRRGERLRGGEACRDPGRRDECGSPRHDAAAEPDAPRANPARKRHYRAFVSSNGLGRGAQQRGEIGARHGRGPGPEFGPESVEQLADRFESGVIEHVEPEDGVDVGR